MRIAALAIYSRTGEGRVLRFRPGLNVVTGWSGTGKSSLLDITEFCLGREHATYPSGVLTRSVAWFAAEIEHGDGRITIARPAPAQGAATSSRAMLAMGASIDDLDGSRLATNTDAKTVRSELTRLLGVPANEVRPERLLRPALSATVSQALLMCFQAQGEIANKQQLFHRTDEAEVRDALRDTLPYFIGAVDVDTVALRRQLDDRRRELRRNETRLERLRLASGRAVEGTSSLLSQAAVLGLTQVPSQAAGGLGMTELRRLANVPDGHGDATERVASEVVTEHIRLRQRELLEEVAAVEHRLAALRRSSAERRDYSGEIEEQHRRLTSIRLLPESGGAEMSSTCPVCGQVVAEDEPIVRSIEEGLTELDRRLEGLRGSEPAAASARRELEVALVQLREDLRGVTADIAAATLADEELVRGGDLASQRAFLRGRITEFISSQPQSTAALEALEGQVAQQSEEVDRLEALLNPISYRERTDSLLRVISADAGQWARRLGLEYSDHGIQIDPTALTVVADTREGPVELSRMGSAANIIGYHVTSHLALHKWFREQNRPVPSFLMLDQPSQAFYPDDVRGAEDEEISDEDRERVEALYTLLRDVVTELDNQFQIIVLDHANLDLPWFQDAVVANWRHGDALVPQAWLTEPGTSR
jgi:hypothetical protein